MTDMTLQEALAQIRAEEPTDMPWRSGVFGGVDRRCAEAIATILNAVASGDLIPPADAELAVAEAIRRAAEEAAAEGWPDEKRIGVSERDEAAMDCANRIETAILALAPAEALAEVQRLRDELAERHALHLEQVRITSEWVAERDAALARVEKLRDALKVTSAVLMAEQNRRGGKPFSGQWSIPAVGFSGTVDDALDQANAALDEDARHAQA